MPAGSYRRLPIATACLGIVLSLGLFYGITRWDQRAAEAHFDAAAQHHLDAIAREWASTIEALESIAAFAAVSPTIKPEVIELIASWLVRSHEQVQAFGWAAGAVDSEIHWQNAASLSNDEGLMMHVTAAAGRLLAEADGGVPLVVSPRVEVPGAASTPAIVVMAAAVDSRLADRGRTQVVAAVSVDRLVLSALGVIPDRTGTIRIHRLGADDQKHLIYADTTADSLEAGALHRATTLEMEHSRWLIEVVGQPQKLSGAALLLLAVGLLLTGGVAGYIYTLTNREEVILRRVDLRTRHLATASAALEGETRLMQAVLHSVADGVAVTDVDGRVLLWNPSAEELLGPRPSGTDPADWMRDCELFTADQQAALPPDELPLAKILRGEPCEDMEFYARGGFAGDGRWLSMSSRPLKDSHRDLLGAMVVFRDITAEKVSERRIRSLNTLLERRVAARTAELRRSNEELQEFAFIASHDLQEPLRKVRMFGDRIRTRCGGVLDDRGRDYLGRMQRASARMEHLLASLLSLSRISTRGEVFAPTNLETVVRETMSDLEVRLAETGAIVDVAELPVIEADATQMRQLFQNLIANSLKFQQDGVAPRIAIEAKVIPHKEGARCCIRLKDNGIGFEQKYAEQIFVPLRRLHGNGAYEGAGIGLATCRKIVERHGGTIAATSAPGEGSEFVIVLPMTHEESEAEECQEIAPQLSL